MKKLISVLLSLCILFVGMPSVLAADIEKSGTCVDPVIYIGGDSNLLYYDNDSKAFSIDEIFGLLKSDEGESNKSKIYEATASILLPFILEGIAFDKWDNYYAAVEKEIGEMFEPVKLDENGNIPETSDCGIGNAALAEKKWKMSTDLKDGNGRYQENAYRYIYDWRLDPIELADDLHEYIEGIKAATGRSKVSITCKCLGTNVVLAYINKYGTESLKGVGIDVATSNGADFLSGMVSGDFTIDGGGLNRLLSDLEYNGDISVHPLIKATIDLLVNTGVWSSMTATARNLLYARIEYGIISALGTSTMMTFPCYWALVTTEDFDSALDYVFGKEGSEKRTKYAGLIEKVTVYNETIKKHVNDIIRSTQVPGKDGKTVNLCIVSKYGTQMLPVTKEGGGVVGDYYVSANKSSFGATTSTIYDTLSEEYIAERVAQGKGKYISPDKQIDASTCLYPDYTWFIKGGAHGFYSADERDLLLTVIDADKQLCIDDFDWTQYIVFDQKNRVSEPMTEENCNNERWKADEKLEKPQTKAERLISFLRSLLNWFKTLFQSLINKRG